MTVFHRDRDYIAFLKLLGQACDRVPMGNFRLPDAEYFRLVLWPQGDGDLGRWMQWLKPSHGDATIDTTTRPDMSGRNA